MKDLQKKMLALYGSLKNLHYCCKGQQYYGMHIMADRLIEDIDPLGVIDHINEHMLGLEGTFIPFQEIVCKEEIASTDPRACLNDVKRLLRNICRIIQNTNYDDLDKGIESYLTGVLDNVISSLGFINQTAGE